MVIDQLNQCENIISPCVRFLLNHNHKNESEKIRLWPVKEKRMICGLKYDNTIIRNPQDDQPIK